MSRSGAPTYNNSKNGHTVPGDEHNSVQERASHRVDDKDTAYNILLFLIAFRVLNALSIKTFFQPDEYFQSLEPAWQMAFGVDSGAWITWVRAYHWLSPSVCTD